MKKLSIKKLNIKNYKSFINETIDFNVPDGINEGSGLNILIGENGNGKTTILEAINYLTLNSYSAENKLEIGDLNNYNNDIEITGYTDDEFNCKLDLPYTGCFFENNGFKFTAESRKAKERGKLLSSTFNIKSDFLNINTNYKKSDGSDSGKPIPWKYGGFDNRIIDDGEINVFFFDKNRNRHSNTGSYKTTFDKITEDLNWKFLKNLTPENESEIISNIAGEYFKNIIEISQRGIGEQLGRDMSTFFDNGNFTNLKIDLLKILSPFSQSFFTIRKDNELNQIDIKDLGSGIEIILSLLLLKSIAGASKGTIIYLIDEPELHLHPKAQEKLLELLLSESKDKQIFISTHSPYMFKNALYNSKVGLFTFNKNSLGEIEISNGRSSSFGLFPWSPSWGEINFYAYKLPTIEFHNELYGYIQEKTSNFSIANMETYLVGNSITKTKNWIRLRGGIAQTPELMTLCSYIRNCIHHPENTNNNRETSIELKKSIDDMIKIIKTNNL